MRGVLRLILIGSRSRLPVGRRTAGRGRPLAPERHPPVDGRGRHRRQDGRLVRPTAASRFRCARRRRSGSSGAGCNDVSHTVRVGA